MDYFVQQLINGLTLGSIYGLIAIGYTMVFGIIGMINFAHGDVFMLSTFIALILFLLLTQVLGVFGFGLALLLVLLAGMALTSLPEGRWLQVNRSLCELTGQAVATALSLGLIEGRLERV